MINVRHVVVMALVASVGAVTLLGYLATASAGHHRLYSSTS